MGYAHTITKQALSDIETLSSYDEKNHKVVPLIAV